MFQNMTFTEVLKLLAPLIFVNICLSVFCLYRLIKDKVRFLPKWAWLPIILFINLLGPIIFLIFGRERDYYA
jgi:hypothetical protein